VAVWQVVFEFVPSQWAEENNFDVDLLYDEDGYDTSTAWVNFQPLSEYKAIFSSILKKAESWSEDLELWGESPIHDISVWHEEGIIESMGFRLDLREDIKDITNSLIAAAEKLNCYLFLPEQRVIFKPNMFAFIQYVRQSGAAKFVTAQWHI